MIEFVFSSVDDRIPRRDNKKSANTGTSVPVYRSDIVSLTETYRNGKYREPVSLDLYSIVSARFLAKVSLAGSHPGTMEPK